MPGIAKGWSYAAMLALVVAAQGCTVNIPGGILANGTALLNANTNLNTTKPATPKPEPTPSPVPDSDGEEEEPEEPIDGEEEPPFEGEEEPPTPDKPVRPPVMPKPPIMPKPPVKPPVAPQPEPWPMPGPDACGAFDKGDTNRDGAVSLAEYTAYERIARKWLPDAENNRLLEEAFDDLDADGDGKLQREERCGDFIPDQGGNIVARGGGNIVAAGGGN